MNQIDARICFYANYQHVSKEEWHILINTVNHRMFQLFETHNSTLAAIDELNKDSQNFPGFTIDLTFERDEEPHHKLMKNHANELSKVIKNIVVITWYFNFKDSIHTISLFLNGSCVFEKESYYSQKMLEEVYSNWLTETPEPRVIYKEYLKQRKK